MYSLNLMEEFFCTYQNSTDEHHKCFPTNPNKSNKILAPIHSISFL